MDNSNKKCARLQSIYLYIMIKVMNENKSIEGEGNSLESTYYNDLKSSLELAKSYNLAEEKFNSLEDYEEQLEFGRLRMVRNGPITRHLNLRVQLLRNGGLKSMSNFDEILISNEEVKEWGLRGAKGNTSEINNKINAYYNQALHLLSSLGYEAKIDGSIITLHKNDQLIQITYSVSQLPGGIGGLSRIKDLTFRVNNRLVARYDNVWLVVCENEKIQKEIDLIVATLS